VSPTQFILPSQNPSTKSPNQYKKPFFTQNPLIKTYNLALSFATASLFPNCKVFTKNKNSIFNHNLMYPSREKWMRGGPGTNR